MPDSLPNDFGRVATKLADRVANLSPDEGLFEGLLRQVEDPAALVRLHARACAIGPDEHRKMIAAEMERRGINV